jgi:hypothetical protein
MVEDITMKHTSLISKLLVGSSQTEPAKVPAPAPAPSQIQTLAAEIKLQILEEVANISVLKNLVIACPDFYPVYCENRYRVLLNCLRKCQDKHTDVLGEVVLKINQLDETESSKIIKGFKLWQRGAECYGRPDRISFIDSKPSLADLKEVSRVQCWVIEMSAKFLQRQALLSHQWVIRYPEIYKWFYYIEIFAALIGDKERGWTAANLPRLHWEREIQCWWSTTDYNIMSAMMKVMWPNGFSKTPASRRRTRALILRGVRDGYVPGAGNFEY